MSIPFAVRANTTNTNSLFLTNYSATPDAVTLADGAISAGGSTLTSASAAFVAGDVGKPIAVEACGAGLTAYAKITSGSSTLTQTWLTVKITATGGTWTYTHTGLGTVSSIAYNVTASALQTALVALYGSAKVTVTLSGTTYTINLLSGAASTNTTQVSTSAAGLTGATGGAAVAALVTYQLWSYADVGKRIQIPGAGTSGGILSAWIGSVEPTVSNIAYLVDSAGTALTASTTVTGPYYTLNWLRTTISVVNSATSISLSTTIDSGVQANLTGLEVHYGTDNTTPLTNAIAAARSTQRPLDLGSGAYLCTAGVTSTSTHGLTMFGESRDATTFRCIPTDAEGESGRLLIGGTSDTARCEGVSLRSFTWSVPTAHTRGAGTVTGQPNNKTNAAGILLSKINYFSIFDVTTKNTYGVAYNIQNCSHGLVSYCRAHNSWADSFNVSDANGSGVGISDITFIGCEAYNSGDDMFATNHYVGNGPRPLRIAFIGCRGYQTRQFGLGRGVAITGGDDITVTGCNMANTNGTGFDVAAARPANTINTVTVTTPSTGAIATFVSAPANMTAGTTQVRLFKNDASGTTWVGNVASVSGGTAVTLTAATGYAATCPFTGANSLAQWGASTDGFRFGTGGSRHVVFTNCISEGSNISPAGDGTLNGAFRANGGAASTEAVTDVQVNSLNVSTCYQSGVLINSAWTSTSSDQSDASSLTSDITISDLSITSTGTSTLTSSRPWPGVYIRNGKNITVNLAKIRDTADEAVLLFTTGIGGRIRLQNIEASDIGRDPLGGVPLAAAFNLSTSTSYTAHLEALFLTNPAGTSGATQYVSTVVVSQPPTGSTIRGVNTDITSQTLLTESATRYSAAISPMLYRGKGSPEGVVAAPPGAVYEDSTGGGVYNKGGGTDSTGWTILSAGAITNPAPELDMLYGNDPCFTAAAGALVAGSVYFVRLRGNGTLSNIIVFPIASLTGNVQVGVYANTGSGTSATPTGSPLKQSASTDVTTLTANTRNPIALSSSQAVTHLNYWFALQVDSATTTWERIAGLGNLGLGYCRSQTGTYSAGTLPAASSPGAAASVWPVFEGS